MPQPDEVADEILGGYFRWRRRSKGLAGGRSGDRRRNASATLQCCTIASRDNRLVEVDLAFSTTKSSQAYERTLGVLIEASSSSSRGPANFGKYPLFMERGRGSRIYDVDGNEYIDWMMAFGALPLGHAHPEIVEAITEAAGTGAHFASATPIELEVAEMIQKIVPNAERVRFANTGTE